MPRKNPPIPRGPRGWNLKSGPFRDLTLPPENLPRGETHYAWKGDAAKRDPKRGRAQRLYKLGPCEHCGKPARDRHHKDDDTGNNIRSNIEILCRSCHMKVDGRMAALIKRQTGRPKRDPLPCVNCNKLYRPLRKGECAACAAYFKRTGNRRPIK